MPRLWYLAHPIAPDSKYSTEENLKHALKVQEILRGHDIWTVAPWFSWVTLYGASKEGEVETFLRYDEAVVEALNFNVIAAGHKLSSGMQRECNFAINNNGNVHILVGTPDRKLGAQVLESLHGQVW